MAPILPLDTLPMPVGGAQQATQPLERTPQGPSFGDTLDQFINSVNDLQRESGSLSERFIKGEAVDLHDVMIAAEKAKTSFQLLMEMRNKALDLYREAMRIQV
jgi:flagellar hook-basal body complex protein FliE